MSSRMMDLSLQWSPDQTVGETMWRPRAMWTLRPSFNGAPTKRSGKLREEGRRPGVFEASMEPRPNGRGNYRVAFDAWAMAVLQWSPDQTVGETHHRAIYHVAA